MSSTQTSPAAKPVSMSGTVAESAAMALRSLTGTGKNSIKLKILNEDGVLTRLVMCLSEHSNPKLQSIAIETLRNLSGAKEDSIKLKIVNEDGALHGIATCLFEHDKGGLQENAVQTLFNLALAEVDSIKLRIVSEDMVLKGLVRTLFQDDKSGLQAYAACPLENLAILRNLGQQKIGNAERTIAGFVKASLEQKLSLLQLSALGALTALSFTRDCSIKQKIANTDGALVGLVKALREHVQPGVSLAATMALKHLANDSSIKQKIANTDGALAGLVECLATLGTREAAAEVLADVADTEVVSIKQNMANENGLLVGLVNCLSQTHPASLRQTASRTLANLANTDDDSIKETMANREGVLASLMKCLPAPDKPGLQGESIGFPVDRMEGSASARLMKCQKRIKVRLIKRQKVASEDGTSARTSTQLSESLSQHKEPGMQEHVAEAREKVSARACLIKKETCC